jgi:diguanylate cyclase (GGDEF)-like protein/PAS domain S-box-containing protein
VRTVVPLSITGEDVALAFRTRERLSRQALEGVETLAAQAALALEGASLAEDLHERQSAERFRSLVQNSSDVIALLSPDLTIRYHTPSVERVLGYGEDELVGTRLSDLLPLGEAERLGGFVAEVCAIPATPMPRDLPLRRKDGTIVQLESVFNNLLAEPNVGGVVVTARDVTERRALEDQLAHQAFHDSLTGLANRALFSERITHAIERGVRRRNLFAVLFVDLDDFKTVNDSLGHAAGDELLVGVAERIRAAIRPEDTCARLGGDEFAVMIESIADPDGAITVARRILGTMAEPLVVEGSEITVQASIGIALGTGGQSASEIMRSADLAMYRAKNEGKARYELYEPSMHEVVVERLELKADLQRAVVSDEFEVHYQPIVALQTGGIVGVEALVRWRHAERGLVLPAEFIDLAEETGLILPLGRHVLNVACHQVAGWRHRGLPGLGVSVNLSAKQLASRHLSGEVLNALADASLDASALTLEITESTLLDSQVVVGRLDELRKLGVRIAIDDFGTGYSSLNYLRRFPVDALKIAKPFVDELGTSPEQDRLVAAIVRLGATMGLETVAEGIERGQQRDRLRALKCRYGQGFLYAQPAPAEELDPLLLSARVA